MYIIVIEILTFLARESWILRIKPSSLSAAGGSSGLPFAASSWKNTPVE
jgi:hypothetical protein